MAKSATQKPQEQRTSLRDMIDTSRRIILPPGESLESLEQAALQKRHERRGPSSLLLFGIGSLGVLLVLFYFLCATPN